MQSNWIKVAPLESLPSDDVTAAKIGDLELAVCRVGEEVYATHIFCTHGHARLSDGFLEGHEIECPLHQGRFDVRTGRATCEPLTEDVRTYPIKVVDGDVFVEVPEIG
ncbi:non-heme iron oxygenase ferredoxin subunit [Caballeronia sp. J97]|uniref:non-heme iron oxygenase ferredoxin subunit n=1 Tax=Caballeronia sp. J97 TaxID=2805429 RepID=UPI002AB015FC|nr:non-heme iron oxygenase ferredoxin subunit [Caballeronia sp. J97]